jgi:uracil-DNA glycosylase
VTLGQLAATAYRLWADTQRDRAAALHLATVRHPTYPESASRAGGFTLAEATIRLLADWNQALPALADHVEPDEPAIAPLALYGDRWEDGDLQPIPVEDLPAGSPPWWRALDAWAVRRGNDRQSKRANITITVPRKAQTWPR